MSNENNEEIELFDYMDEESESRKIPVNKKEKTGGKSGRSKKKKKAGALTWVGRVAATIGITLALIIVWLYGVMAGSCIWTFKDSKKSVCTVCAGDECDRIPR